MRWKWIFLAPLVILAFVGFIAVGGVVVQQLWNWLLPSVFGWRQVTFWQALGMLALCRILFGSFGGSRSSSGSRIRGRMADRFADRVGERIGAMTPEERERFRQRVRDRCGFDPSGSETSGRSGHVESE